VHRWRSKGVWFPRGTSDRKVCSGSWMNVVGASPLRIGSPMSLSTAIHRTTQSGDQIGDQKPLRLTRISPIHRVAARTRRYTRPHENPANAGNFSDRAPEAREPDALQLFLVRVQVPQQGQALNAPPRAGGWFGRGPIQSRTLLGSALTGLRAHGSHDICSLCVPIEDACSCCIRSYCNDPDRLCSSWGRRGLVEWRQLPRHPCGGGTGLRRVPE
jgi:hypothetical protein